MAKAAKAIPQGDHSVTPYLVVPVQDMFTGTRLCAAPHR